MKTRMSLKERIYQFLKDNPKTTLKHISDTMGCSVGAVRYHLTALTIEGRLSKPKGWTVV
jgi:predicted transcriptional regulator